MRPPNGGTAIKYEDYLISACKPAPALSCIPTRANVKCPVPSSPAPVASTENSVCSYSISVQISR